MANTPLTRACGPVDVAPTRNTMASLGGFILGFRTKACTFPCMRFARIICLRGGSARRGIGTALSVNRRPCSGIVVALTRTIATTNACALMVPTGTILRARSS